MADGFLTDYGNPDAPFGTGDYGGGGDTGGGFNYGAATTAIGGVVGGIGSFLAGKATAKADRARAAGYAQESTAYSQAAGYAEGNVKLAEESTAIKKYQTERLVKATIGKQEAQVGGAGFTESGTGLYLLRASAAQGALATGLVSVQGAIAEQGYRAQAAADVALSNEALTAEQAAKSAAGSAETAGTLGLIGGIAKGVLSGAAALFMGG